METKTIRFVPNYDLVNNKVSNPSMTLNMTTRGKKGIKNLTFSKVYVDGKISTFKYGKSTKQKIQDFLGGCYVNSDGLYLCEYSSGEKLTYYMNKVDGHIRLRLDGYSDRREDYTVKKDITRLDPINLFDLGGKYELRYDVLTEDNGLIHNINYRLVETKPLYEEGMDKNEIFKLYDGVPTIEESMSEYEKNNPDMLYGEDALNERRRLYMKEDIQRLKGQLEDKIKAYDERFGTIEKLINRVETINKLLDGRH